jgi:hypothetical protein
MNFSLGLLSGCRPAARVGCSLKQLSSAVCLLATLLLACQHCPPVAAQAQAADLSEKAGLSGKNVEDDATPVLGTKWVRLKRDKNDDLVGLQTAIIRYRPAAKTGVTKKAADSTNPPFVDLVGAIHVGDKEYYDKLNAHFKQYDALLYELVAPDGSVVARGRGTSNRHPVGMLQNGMKQMLELDHQLEQIDYTKSNFVHADMSPDQFAESMQNRGESFLQLYFRLIGQSIGHQSRQAKKGQSMDVQLFTALFSSDRARQLKKLMATQLAEMESIFLGLGGEEGTTLISERNKVALQVLKKELAAGKSQLGVFYGAGHLVDMDERLRQDFGLEPVSVKWVTAWDLTK